MQINCTVRTLMGHCTQVNSTVCLKRALHPRGAVLCAQIVPCTHKNSNSGLSSSVEIPCFLYTTFLHLFYGLVKKNDLSNLNAHVKINKIEWMA